jgi:hypothetical protein
MVLLGLADSGVEGLEAPNGGQAGAREDVGEGAPDLRDLRGGEPGVAVALARGAALAPPRHHVGVVLGGRARYEVRRPDAAPGIAEVTQGLPPAERPSVEPPRDAVGELLGAVLHLPVTLRGGASRPEPARPQLRCVGGDGASRIDVGPEPRPRGARPGAEAPPAAGDPRRR